MATGKTNTKHYRLYVSDVDLSGDSRQVGNFGAEFVEDAVQGWSDGVENFTLGYLKAMIDGYQAVFNNTLVTGSHIKLSGALGSEVLASLCVGIKAAPAAGDLCFAMPLLLSAYKPDGQGPVLVSASLNGPGQGTYTLPTKVFGVVLMPSTALSGTTNGSTVDNGAASSNGLLVYLHILASSGGTWAFKVQHSTDGSAWSDLISFSANGSAITAEQGASTGTVNQYLRFVATRTSGTVTVVCTAVRQ